MVPPGAPFDIEWDMAITGYGTAPGHTATIFKVGSWGFAATEWAQTACGDTQMHSYRLEARATGLSIFCDWIVSPIITRNTFDVSNFVMPATRSVGLG